MRSVVVLPGRPSQWVTDHARDLAQRLSDHGAVVVAFLRQPENNLPLPGQSPPASVLGHSPAGHPLWTGRVMAGLGPSPRHRVAVIVVWHGANSLLTLVAAVAARARGDFTIVDIAEPQAASMARRRMLIGSLVRRLAHDVVEVTPDPTSSNERTLLALCGDDLELAQLVLSSLDSMGADAASSWRCEVRVDESLLGDLGPLRPRHSDLVDIAVVNGESLGPADVDVVVASARGEESTVVRESVAAGGAGVLVGSAQSQVVRCHDGIWLARRDVAALLVAIEASAGRSPRTSVSRLRDVARRIERRVWEFELQQRERWAGRPRQVAS